MPRARHLEAMKFFIMLQSLSMLDGVGVVRASLLKDLLEVVHGRPRLMLPAACNSRATHHDGAPACLLMPPSSSAMVAVSWAMLLVPLLAALGTHLDIMDDDIGWCFPAATWGWVKLGRLVADGILGDDATQLLGGLLDDVG
jgi:hypothetical protein